jgi:hypothetical protein
MYQESRYWTYETPYGHFRIYHAEKPSTNLWNLEIAGEYLASFPSPEAAAESVRSQTTGHTFWDKFKGKLPDDLFDWLPLGA